MDFDLQFGRRGRSKAGRRGLQGPMRILILGDLTGDGARSEHRPATAAASRKTCSIDIDNFEQVMARLAPRLQPEGSPPGGAEGGIEFKSLDDFHPDGLFRRLAMFEPMRTMRARLLDPATSAAAIAELAPGAVQRPGGPEPGRTATGPKSPANLEDDQKTLARLLGPRPVDVARSAARLARQQVDLDRFLRDIVAPHVVQGAHPAQRQLVDAVDGAAGALMRVLLHDPALQALEALWRSLHGLVVNLETGEDLEIHLLDLSREALEAEMVAAAADPASSALFRLLVEEGPGDPGERSWSLLVGDYRFGNGERDTRNLAAVASIASRAGAPFLAAADPLILGCRSLHDSPDPRTWPPVDAAAQSRWAGLRASPEAGWVGLALPRLLLRLPYGRDTDEVEQFAFEELAGNAHHEDYLWGNPAIACARLLGESFTAGGAAMQPGDHLDLGDLPAHTRLTDDGPALQACAEVFLPERAADAILQRGLMPLMSFKNRNMVRLVRFQSIADPPGPLSGPWEA
jgi:type VI secretion system protein ImpC